MYNRHLFRYHDNEHNEQQHKVKDTKVYHIWSTYQKYKSSKKVNIYFHVDPQIMIPKSINTVSK